MTDREAIEYFDQVLKYADEFLHAGDYNAKTLKEIEVIKQALSALKEREERSKGHQWKITLEELPKSEEDVLLYWCDSDTMAVGFALYENDGPVSWCAYTGGEWFTDCNSSPDLWTKLPARPLKGADNG